MTHFHKLLGTEGERHAERYLKGLGYLFVTRNYRAKSGEIDLIFLDGEELCFVEVKTMSEKSRAVFGDPANKVDEKKIRHITLAAAEFCRRYHDHFPDASIRFDVAEVTFTPQKVLIDYKKHAHSAQTGFQKKKLF